MKKVLSIVLLAVVTLASISLEATGRRKCNTGRNCCFPCVFSGAGTTELGQLVNPNDPNALPYLGFLGLNAQNYSRVKKCPIFEYNGIDTVTKQPFEQGSEAGVSQTIEGVTLFGGTMCPNSSDLCQNGGDLLNFPVAVDGLAIVAVNVDSLTLTASTLAQIFSGNQFFQAVVREDSSCTTGFLNQYIQNSAFAGFTWSLFGNGPFDTGPNTDPDTWSGAVSQFPGNQNKINPVLGAENVMKKLQELNDQIPAQGAVGYIAYSDFVRFTNTYPAVVLKGVETIPASGAFAEPSPESFTLAVENAISGGVPADLLIETNISNNQMTPVDNPQPYPITFTTNVVVRCCQFAKCQVIELRKFLYYLATTGQVNAEQFGLATLPSEVVSQYITNLNLLQYSEDCIDNLVTKCCES